MSMLSNSSMDSTTPPRDFVAGPSTPMDTKSKIITIVLAVLTVAWALFGLVAFVFSLICFGYSGSVSEKVLGFLLAILIGPFYFIYYFASGSYCKTMPPTIY
jgi:hypothetical protein